MERSTLKASNVSATSFAENRTFRAFLGMYILMSMLILLLIGSIYYEYRRDGMLSDHRLAMSLESETYIPKIKTWLKSGADKQNFPKDLAYATALYDAKKKPMATRLVRESVNVKKTMQLKENYIHYVVDLAPYEMGSRYLIFETKDDGLWFQDTLQKMVLFGLFVFTLLVGLGIYLSSLFLRPMRQALTLLDDFIQDTTHELNTPVSAILINIEALDFERLDEKNSKKINRIEIAARTISTIYDDLTYLILNHERIQKNELIDMSSLIQERLEYFKHRYTQKKIQVRADICKECVVEMDRTKAIRIIDNLLSNAIKYNEIKGHINISFHNKNLVVSNSGRGIDATKIHRIFERYQRADKSVGGFGIGLHIVAMIAQEYNISITVDSEVNAMTTLRLTWP